MSAASVVQADVNNDLDGQPWAPNDTLDRFVHHRLSQLGYGAQHWPQVDRKRTERVR
jgi:hypothetical protein